MANAKREFDWQIAAHQMALTHNMLRGPQARAKRPSDFNPFAPRKKKTFDDIIKAFI